MALAARACSSECVMLCMQIKRDLHRIGGNLVLVVFPFKNRDQQSAALRNWDLWGPMVGAPCQGFLQYDPVWVIGRCSLVLHGTQNLACRTCPMIGLCNAARMGLLSGSTAKQW